MNVKFTNWEVTDYLNTEEKIGYFLESAFEDGTPEEISHALEAVNRARVRWGLVPSGTEIKDTSKLSETVSPALTEIFNIIKPLKLRLTVASPS